MLQRLHSDTDSSDSLKLPKGKDEFPGLELERSNSDFLKPEPATIHYAKWYKVLLIHHVNLGLVNPRPNPILLSRIYFPVPMECALCSGMGGIVTKPL